MNHARKPKKQRRVFSTGHFHYCYYALATTPDPANDGKAHIITIARAKAEQDGLPGVAACVNADSVAKAKYIVRKFAEERRIAFDKSAATQFWKERLRRMKGNVVLTPNSQKSGHRHGHGRTNASAKKTQQPTAGRHHDLATGVAFCAEAGGLDAAQAILDVIRRAVRP